MAESSDEYIVVDLTANNAHCYPDAKTPPDFGFGVCRQNHGLQEFGDGYMNEKVATARAAALNAGLPGSSIVNDSEPPCDCSSAHPGILWPWAPDSDDSLPFVERCDDCQLYASDDAAADALAKAIGSRVMWADLHEEPERLHPFVLSPEASRAMNEAPITHIQVVERDTIDGTYAFIDPDQARVFADRYDGATLTEEVLLDRVAGAKFLADTEDED